jgi:hypothetical protein
MRLMLMLILSERAAMAMRRIPFLTAQMLRN